MADGIGPEMSDEEYHAHRGDWWKSFPAAARALGSARGPRQAAETGPHLRLKACASAARGTIEAVKWCAAWNNLDDWGRDESVIQNDRQPLEYHWIF